MKESLDIESRDSLIAYRIERAYGSLQEAKLMAEGGFYNASINRLYYACYYMAVALLLKNNISAHFLRKDIAVTMMLLYIVTRKCSMNFTQRLRHSLRR